MAIAAWKFYWWNLRHVVWGNNWLSNFHPLKKLSEQLLPRSLCYKARVSALHDFNNQNQFIELALQKIPSLFLFFYKKYKNFANSCQNKNVKKGKLKSKTAAKQLSTKLLNRKCSFMQFLLNDMENFLFNVLCSALAFKKFMQNFWRFFNHANLNVKIYQVVLFRFFCSYRNSLSPDFTFHTTCVNSF